MATAQTNRISNNIKSPKRRKATKLELQDGIMETIAADCPCKDMSTEEYFRRISEKAYDLYQKRGCGDGNEQNDWFEAERLVKEELNKIF